MKIKGNRKSLKIAALIFIDFRCQSINLVYFEINFWIFVYALVIIGRDKRSLCEDGSWRPIDLRHLRPRSFCLSTEALLIRRNTFFVLN